MEKLAYVLIVCLLATTAAYAAKSINSHLTNVDLERLQHVFADGLNSNDIQSIYFGALNLKQTTKDENLKTCNRITQLHKDSKLNDFEKNFYLVSTYSKLQCATAIPNTIQTAISLNKDFATAHELYFNYFSSKAIGVSIKEDTKTALIKNIQNILKKDDSLSSLGHAFHVAAELGTAAASIADWVEGAFAQADELDGKMLQFEGGLSVTALLVNGAFKLTSALNKAAPINEDQAVKFTTYFLSRRSVQTAKGASVLLEVLTTIAKDQKLAPLCIQIIGNGHLQLDAPVINVKVVDILGKPSEQSITTVSATATKKGETAVVLPKTSLVSKSSDKTVYSLDLKPAKLTRGTYFLDITADAFKQTATVKVLGKVKVISLEIGVGEIDSTSAVKKQTVSYPNKLSDELNADAQQKVVLRAVLVDEITTRPVTVHQAFVRLENKETKEEIIFVAEQDSAKAYKFDMDIGARSNDFGHKSGLYSLEFIVGDASLSNSFKWLVADVQLKFTQEPNVINNGQVRAPRPEILHQFREPEKRPARFVSDLFTALSAAPILVLFLLWNKLKVNVSNFPVSLSALGFHVGFGAILSLFGIFFWKLNMFETIRYLIPLAIVTFICGNRLLRSIASRTV